jgi:hypothetical protein
MDCMDYMEWSVWMWFTEGSGLLAEDYTSAELWEIMRGT